MIQLTRLKGREIIINVDLIKFIESAPDTMLTLSTGEKMFVQEAPDDIIAKVVAFKQKISTAPIIRALELD